MADPYFNSSFPFSRIHQPPPGEYFELHHSRRRSSNTPISPPVDPLFRPDISPYQSPDLYSPEIHGDVHLPYSSQPSLADSRRSTRQSIPRDIEVQSLIQHRSRMTSVWGIHWWTPFALISLFLLGVIGSVAHHAFYRGLDGKEAKDQLWMNRIGLGMAFFTKASLVGCVILSYKQRVWYSLRRQAMTISAIDGLFAIVEDPTQFVKWEMLKSAKLATLMAVAIWTIPLAAVFTPATLTSTLGNQHSPGKCDKVPNLNFKPEETMNYRDPVQINGGMGIALSYWNTTDPNGTAPGFFDYYDQPAKNAVKLASIAAFLKKPVDLEGANLLACGSASWNCSYTISFDGPGYQCAEIASGVGANLSELASLGAPFNTSTLVPEGFDIYRANVSIGDYAPIQTPTDADGVPIPPLPYDLGVFKSEPILWVGYSIDTNNSLPSNSPYAHWKTEHIPKIFACEHYYTKYAVAINYTSGTQFVNVTKRDFIHPVINTTLAQYPDGSGNPFTAVPEGNYIRPNADVGLYKLTAAYHTLGLLLREQLSGTIDMETVQPRTKTQASATRLVNQRNFYPVPDLQFQVQSFYEDIILSLLADPQMIVGTTSSVSCIRTRRATVFKYVPEGLWIGYALALTVAFGFLIVGFHAMINNGVASDTVFSRILTTTRNSTLDHLAVGACLGSDPFPKELERTKLKFGVLREDGVEEGWIVGEKVGHCAFGTEDQIGRIVRGAPYAGLKSGWKGWRWKR